MIRIIALNIRDMRAIFWLDQTFGSEQVPWKEELSEWDCFVEENLLQDYVFQEPDGSYGEPKELWEGHFTGDNVPKKKKDFMEFWENAVDRILRRSIRIYQKLQEVSQSGANHMQGEM